jgi:RND family efflux transporter MFP subunit
MRNEGGRMKISFNKIAFLILSIVVSVGLAACGGSRAESKANANTAEQQQPQTVDTMTEAAVLRQLPQYFEATGTLASDAQTDLAPTVGGKVVAVNFDVGGYVQRGDVLVRLDDRDARIRLEQAQAQVAQAQSQVNAARANVEQFRANLRAVRAQLGLGETDGFDVNNIAEVKTARAALDLAERQLRRFERLLESGDVSRAQYDQQKAQRDQARAAYEAALNGANQRFAGVRTAQAQIDAAQAQVGTAQRAAEAAQTQVESANKAVADTIVRSPISGSVLERNADLGEFVSTAGKIATIVRTNPLRARIDIPEQSIGNTRVGQSISLSTSAYPDRQFAGTIVRIVPGLNTTSRTLVAEAEVNNVDGLLKPGQFATVRILLPEARPAVMIPTRAVRQDGTTNRVFVVRDGRAEMRVVQLGETENDVVEVRNGVTADERVATSNLELLVDGVEVRQ